MRITKQMAEETISKIKKDPKYIKGMDENNPNGYIMTGKKLFEAIISNSNDFKEKLMAFATAVNAANHTHLYNISKQLVVDNMTIEDFNTLSSDFSKGYEIMCRVQKISSRSIYSFLTKLFQTYCHVNYNNPDMYPKYDSVVRNNLPVDYQELFGKKITIGKKLDSYLKYVNYVDDVCKAHGIGRFEYDQYIWYNCKK